MNVLLEEYININRAIAELETKKEIIEKQLLDVVRKTNKETLVLDDVTLSISYRNRYDIDKKIVYEILQPKNLFINVVSVRKSSLDYILKANSDFSEEVVERLMDSVNIKSVTEHLTLKNK